MNKPNAIMNIQGRSIGNDFPTYFIADIAANHDGDLERAKDLIYKAADAGADAAKFQHFKAETIVSDFGFKAMNGKQSHQASWRKSVYEVYKDASVNLEWTAILEETCKKAGIPFFTTPYALDIIDQINQFVPAYKIGSGDITWLDLIEKVASMQKPYIIATGASSADEVHRAITAALSINPQVALMQCNTNYTASIENFKFIQLNVIKTYRNMYPNMLLGLSDHTPGHATVLGAVALGARMIEKHFTDDRNRLGPDHKFSMDPFSWRDMVDRTRELEASLGDGVKKIEGNEAETVIVQRRSLRAAHSLKKGDVIKTSDFIALRPCPIGALEPFEINKVIGKTLCKDLLQGEHISLGDIA